MKHRLLPKTRLTILKLLTLRYCNLIFICIYTFSRYDMSSGVMCWIYFLPLVYIGPQKTCDKIFNRSESIFFACMILLMQIWFYFFHKVPMAIQNKTLSVDMFSHMTWNHCSVHTYKFDSENRRKLFCLRFFLYVLYLSVILRSITFFLGKGLKVFRGVLCNGILVLVYESCLLRNMSNCPWFQNRSLCIMHDLVHQENTGYLQWNHCNMAMSHWWW